VKTFSIFTQIYPDDFPYPRDLHGVSGIFLEVETRIVPSSRFPWGLHERWGLNCRQQRWFLGVEMPHIYIYY
jgi:hypothetical protein